MIFTKVNKKIEYNEDIQITLTAIILVFSRIISQSSENVMTRLLYSLLFVLEMSCLIARC